ncbi:hypothetical protein AG0111_0g6496 [Alternaria gaisen]|uniref:Uncharacterized protein n=1 Tax=Alternaria gaisen TaxID=167740 RepID=A0ACB6FK77_9PLEO|nr:hypothetical protein AG0111_0g6496 [Alternaria gaisen]
MRISTNAVIAAVQTAPTAMPAIAPVGRNIACGLVGVEDLGILVGVMRVADGMAVATIVRLFAASGSEIDPGLRGGRVDCDRVCMNVATDVWEY